MRVKASTVEEREEKERGEGRKSAFVSDGRHVTATPPRCPTRIQFNSGLSLNLLMVDFTFPGTSPSRFHSSHLHSGTGSR